MKRTLVLLGVILISTITNGQDKKMSLGAFATFDQYDYDFKPVESSDSSYEINDAFTVGLNFRYKFSERLFGQGGLQYSERGYKFEGWVPLEAGVGMGDPAIFLNPTENLSYIGIPLFLGYYVKDGERFKIAPAFGFVTELLVSDNQELRSDALNSILFAPQLNLGFEYHIGNKWFASLEPYIRLNTIAVQPAIMESTSISYGGIFSVNYKL